MYKTDFISLYEELSTINAPSQLTEAFRYLRVGSKPEIIDRLKDLGHYRNDTLAIPLAGASFTRSRTITDFIIVPVEDGTDIEVVLKIRSQNMDTREFLESTEYVLLDTLYNREPRSRAKDFLRQLRDAARAVDRELRPNIIQRRNQNVAQALAPREIAEMFRKHVTGIRFTIPSSFAGYDVGNLPGEDMENAEAAVEKLNTIHANFYDLAFAQDAYDAGIVTDRDPSVTTDSNARIATYWREMGTVTFDRPLQDLPAEMLEVILLARGRGEAVADQTSNTVNCYRLAKELIIRFNNDINFFR
jgi:hypothetical protein